MRSQEAWKKEKEKLQQQENKKIDIINNKIKEKVLKLQQNFDKKEQELINKKNSAIQAIKNLKENSASKTKKLTDVVKVFRGKVQEINKEKNLKQKQEIEKLQAIVKNTKTLYKKQQDEIKKKKAERTTKRSRKNKNTTRETTG